MDAREITNEAQILVETTRIRPCEVFVEFLKAILNGGGLSQGFQEAQLDIPFSHGRNGPRE